MAEARELHVAPDAAPLDEHREPAEERVPRAAHLREAADVRVELEEVRGLVRRPRDRRRHESAGAALGRAARVDLVKPGPAVHLRLERLLLLGERRPPRELHPLVWTELHRVGAEVLLAERLDPLPFRWVRTEDLPGERERLVHDGALLRSEGEIDTLPRLVVAVARRTPPGDLLEGAYRLRPRPCNPHRLGVANSQGQDDLRLPRAHLPAVNGSRRTGRARSSRASRAMLCEVRGSTSTRSRA